MTIELRFHGAAGAVTGSCMEIGVAGRRLLIDCGLFQGSRSLEALNYEELPFDPAAIDLVLLTHAHLDHSGRLPVLMRQGYEGQLWCTPATGQLLAPLLMDAAKLQAADAERRNERPDRAGMAPFAPLYDFDDVAQLVSRVHSLVPGKWAEPLPGIAVRFWDARHILGAVSIELRADGQSLLFSGDIGIDAALPGGPETPEGGWDHLVCEATYGDRDREAMPVDARREALARVAEDTIKRGGNLIIPSFALQRTQVLIEDLAALFDSKRLGNIQVYIDAPLADRVTRVYRRFDTQPKKGGSPFDHPQVHFTRSVAESRALNRMSGVIILAGAGMCSGGRVRYHLARNLPRAESTILFVGYQARGTLGAVLRGGARAVRISGTDISVRAEVAVIDAYSAHADRKALLTWLTARSPCRGSLFLDHGEAPALTRLARDAAILPGHGSVIIPKLGEAFALDARTPARRIAEARPDADALAGEDWHNRAAALRASFDNRLATLPDSAARDAMLAALERTLAVGNARAA